MSAKQNIVHGRGPSNINLGIFVCSFDVCRASQPIPSKKHEQEDMGIVLVRRRWRWIGHVLRREITSISKVALRWTPEGKRKRGRPKSTWRRTAEAELQALNLN